MYRFDRGSAGGVRSKVTGVGTIHFIKTEMLWNSYGCSLFLLKKRVLVHWLLGITLAFSLESSRYFKLKLRQEKRRIHLVSAFSALRIMRAALG